MTYTLIAVSKSGMPVVRDYEKKELDKMRDHIKEFSETRACFVSVAREDGIVVYSAKPREIPTKRDEIVFCALREMSPEERQAVKRVRYYNGILKSV